MPIDTVKTSMQSIEAKSLYKNSFDCVAKIFKNEGVLVFWSGALPRLARLILSGGIVFTMYGDSPFLDIPFAQLTSLDRYEKTMEGLDRFDPERKYI